MVWILPEWRAALLFLLLIFRGILAKLSILRVGACKPAAARFSGKPSPSTASWAWASITTGFTSTVAIPTTSASRFAAPIRTTMNARLAAEDLLSRRKPLQIQRTTVGLQAPPLQAF